MAIEILGCILCLLILIFFSIMALRPPSKPSRKEIKKEISDKIKHEQERDRFRKFMSLPGFTYADSDMEPYKCKSFKGLDSSYWL